MPAIQQLLDWLSSELDAVIAVAGQWPNQNWQASTVLFLMPLS
ncbi:hypothetical protein AAULH_00863 [Lactobacillus helveticus MTCC 5463]|nr:hypothetical protein AAULH_00863 [Lactobacillus helveticus MTCC 5463]